MTFVTCDLVLAFEGGDPSHTVVLSLLHEAQPLSCIAGAPASDHRQLQVDGVRCILSARHELVPECGRARLVLRADGRAARASLDSGDASHVFVLTWIAFIDGQLDRMRDALPVLLAEPDHADAGVGALASISHPRGCMNRC